VNRHGPITPPSSTSQSFTTYTNPALTQQVHVVSQVVVNVPVQPLISSQPFPHVVKVTANPLPVTPIPYAPGPLPGPTIHQTVHMTQGSVPNTTPPGPSKVLFPAAHKRDEF
jgi:hypothetical protein